MQFDLLNPVKFIAGRFCCNNHKFVEIDSSTIANFLSYVCSMYSIQRKEMTIGRKRHLVSDY
jgi:hypothetical protein